MTITAREEQVKDLVNIHNKLIPYDRCLQLKHNTYFKRAFSSHVSGSDTLVVLPSHVREASDFRAVHPIAVVHPRAARSKEERGRKKYDQSLCYPLNSPRK